MLQYLRYIDASRNAYTTEDTGLLALLSPSLQMEMQQAAWVPVLKEVRLLFQLPQHKEITIFSLLRFSWPVVQRATDLRCRQAFESKWGWPTSLGRHDDECCRQVPMFKGHGEFCEQLSLWLRSMLFFWSCSWFFQLLTLLILLLLLLLLFLLLLLLLLLLLIQMGTIL